MKVRKRRHSDAGADGLGIAPGADEVDGRFVGIPASLTPSASLLLLIWCLLQELLVEVTAEGIGGEGAGGAGG